jgi:hypothetical protein
MAVLFRRYRLSLPYLLCTCISNRALNRTCHARQQPSTVPPPALCLPVSQLASLITAHIPPRSASAESVEERARPLHQATLPQSKLLWRTVLPTAPFPSIAATRNRPSTCSARQSRHLCRAACPNKPPCPAVRAAALQSSQTDRLCRLSQRSTSQKRKGEPAMALL